jgi:hypothetical protein
MSLIHINWQITICESYFNKLLLIQN